MSLPSSPVLQRLHCLDIFSPDFQDQLNNVLSEQEYRQCLSDLGKNDLVWLVGHLDKILDAHDPSRVAFRKCLCELRYICSTKSILPESCILSPTLPEINPDPFTSGRYGDIYLGTWDDLKVYAKRMRVYGAEVQQKVDKIFYREAVVWKHLAHPNIVPFLGVTAVPLQLISEQMQERDLPEYIEANSNVDRLGLLLDVAKGLHFLHSCSVTHGDIQGSNILVDETHHARITDFGFAIVIKEDGTQDALYEVGPTPRWTAPEVLNGGAYTKAADIFSFSMLMIEVFTGEIPYSDRSTFKALLDITEGKRPQRPTHPAVTDNVWDLIQHCWNQDPCLRPAAAEILQPLSI